MNMTEIRSKIKQYRIELILLVILVLGMIAALAAGRASGSDLARPFLGIWFVAFFVIEAYRKIADIDIYKLWQDIRSNRLLIKCMAAGSIMMFITHMFVYVNAMYIHDAISIGSNVGGYTNPGGEKWASYFMSIFTMGMTLPWVSGLLTVFSICASLYILALILNESDMVSLFIMAGVMATNSSLIAHHTYVGGEHVAGISILFTCLALYFTCRSEDRLSGFLKSIVLIAFATGFYGAYTPLYPSVLIGLLILELLKGEEPVKDIVLRGVRYCVTFLSGMVLFYACLKISLWYSQSVMQEYMGENKIEHGIDFIQLISLVPAAFIRSIQYYLGLDDYYPPFIRVFKFIICVLLVITVALIIKEKKESLKKDGRMIWFLLLLLIWPISINLIKILTFGNTHFLMAFTFVTPYLFIPKALRWLRSKGGLSLTKNMSLILTIAMACFIYGGVLFANSVYVHVDDMYLINQSIATRMLDRIEQCEGFTGDEKVVILGDINYDEYLKHSTMEDKRLKMLDVNSIAQIQRVNGFTYPETISSFMKNIYNSKLDFVTQPSVEDYIAGSGVSAEEADFIRSLSDFPRNGSVGKFGDRIYVRFCDEGEGIGFSTGNKSEIYEKIREIYRQYVGIR